MTEVSFLQADRSTTWSHKIAFIRENEVHCPVMFLNTNSSNSSCLWSQHIIKLVIFTSRVAESCFYGQEEDGSESFAVNYGLLNSVTEPMQFPLLVLGDVFDTVGESLFRV